MGTKKGKTGRMSVRREREEDRRKRNKERVGSEWIVQ